MSLLTSRRLAPLLVTQALGALNDNLFKNALVVLILFRAASTSGPALVALAGGVFILPYVLLSATAGQIADRFEKSRTILLVKLAELALMGLAAAGFLLGSTPLLFAVLFGLGVQATFFGPLKYAILPDHLAAHELVAGNGLVEAGHLPRHPGGHPRRQRPVRAGRRSRPGRGRRARGGRRRGWPARCSSPARPPMPWPTRLSCAWPGTCRARRRRCCAPRAPTARSGCPCWG